MSLLMSKQRIKAFLSFNSKIQRISKVQLHRMTKMFPPIREAKIDKKIETISTEPMFDHNIISSQHSGLFTLLPFGLRAVEKLINIIDAQMKKAGCQKLYLPHLTSTSLWKKSGRYDDCGSEIFRLHDSKNHEYLLSPTHEEAITSLVSSFQPLSHSNLPIYVYQISTKFRDEKRSKHGLLRSREFLMKDLYTFDKNLTAAKDTYKTIVNVYDDLFTNLGIPFKKVKANVGTIGGIKSHEFHVLSDVGEDSILSCTSCGFSANIDVLSDEHLNTCQSCGTALITKKGIEVGHSFLLGTKYSVPLSAQFKDEDGFHPMYMGCYGIGITRLLAAGIEVLSTENQLIWPKNLAPFKVCLIPPKRGSKEECASHWCYHLEYLINEIANYKDEVVVDDRLKLTVGKRYNYAKEFGFPIIIIVGKSAVNRIPMFELFQENNKMVLSQSDLLQYLKTH
ncbi:putative proline--tRNA ligase, mitochondrial [Armadillidium nasatum]|uniref:Probable proline--tRNA ligase, mitochondrial n=1 Tax=Armadillidium nasatum TaxID=96803 RepID=A0A5N5TGG4_9CRUS|nr:putative proline--tRNA ligase, mitochondrial [Armadillidium nasatum]